MTEKKTYVNRDNPAMNFISQVGQTEADPAEEPVNTPPEGYKLNMQYVEKKTRRLQLIVQPSLYKKIKKKADKQHLSVNEFIHRILEKALEE